MQVKTDHKLIKIIKLELNFELQVIVSSPRRLSPYTCLVDPPLNRLGRALASGNTETIAKLLAHQDLHEIVVPKVLNSIDEECVALCRRADPTAFRKIPLEELQDFKWSKYIGEMEVKSPLLLKLLKMIVEKIQGMTISVVAFTFQACVWQLQSF